MAGINFENEQEFYSKPLKFNDGYTAVAISNSLEIDHNFQQELTNKIIKDISEQKQQAFIDRLKVLGIEINFDDEQKRRFKRFFSEFKDNEETIYFNDGSVESLRIITYVTKQTPFDFKDRSVSVGYETTYY